MEIIQRAILISPKSRGCHIITSEIESELPEMRRIEAGIAHIMIQHTSASLTVNENADPTVRDDFETFFSGLVPEDTTLYKHTMEGTDDMTSHIKSSIIGSSVTVPVSGGKFNLGLWQGIYLCEHRNNGKNRRIIITIIGE